MALLSFTNLQLTDHVSDNSAIGAYQRIEFTIDGDQASVGLGNYEFTLRIGWTNTNYSDQNSVPQTDVYYFENLNLLTSYTFAGRWQAGSNGDRDKVISDASFITVVDNGGDIQIQGTLYFQNYFDVNANYGSVASSSTPRFFYTKDSKNNNQEINNGFATDIYSQTKNFNLSIWAVDSTNNDLQKSELKYETGLRFYNREIDNVDPTILRQIAWQARQNNAPVSDIGITSPTEIYFTFENISAYPNANISNTSLTDAWMLAVKTSSTNNTSTPQLNNEVSVGRLNGPAAVDSTPFNLTHEAQNLIFDVAPNTSSLIAQPISTPNYFQSFITLDPTNLTVGDTYRFIYFIRLTQDAVNPNLTQGTQDYTFISDEYTVINDVPESCDLLSDFLTIKKSEICDYYSCYLNTPNLAPGERLKVRNILDFRRYNSEAPNFSKNGFNALSFTARTVVTVNGNEVANVDRNSMTLDISTNDEMNLEHEFVLPYTPGTGSVETTVRIPQVGGPDTIVLRQNFEIEPATPNQLTIRSQYTNGSPLQVLCEQEVLDIQSCAEHTNLAQSTEIKPDTNFHMASTLQRGLNPPITPIENQDTSPTGISTSDDPIITTQDVAYDSSTNIACSTLNTASLPVDEGYNIYHYRKGRGYGLDFENAGEIISVLHSNLFYNYDAIANVTTRKVIELSFYLKSISECTILSKYSQSGDFGFEFGIDGSGRYRFTKYDNPDTYSDQMVAAPTIGYNHVILQISGNENQNRLTDVFNVNNLNVGVSNVNPPSFPKHLFFDGINSSLVNDGPLVFGDDTNNTPIILFSAYMYEMDIQIPPYNNFIPDQFNEGVNRTPYFVSGGQSPIFAFRMNKRDGTSVNDFSDNNLVGTLQGFGGRTAFSNGAWIIK